MAGFEPAWPGSRSRWIKPLSPHPEKKWLVPSGQWLEKIGFVFLPHKCSSGFVLLATNHWPLTTAAMGPEGLEPSPRWLRARHAAANTWIPKIGPEGVEPSSGPYKRPALAVELRAKPGVRNQGSGVRGRPKQAF